MDDPIVFKIIGIPTSSEYQKCKAYARKMHRNLPTKFAVPVLLPKYDLSWEEYLTKMRRNNGGKWWQVEGPVVVLINDVFLGDQREFVKLLKLSYKIQININFEQLGVLELSEFIVKSERTHVYLTISGSENVIGILLFQLYTDLVPLACDNFIKLCTERPGYKCRSVHRIVKSSWIQFGGAKSKATQFPCENYIVPHDRRGVLSTCNKVIHSDNSMQFFVSLNPTPWMDYKYVAIGQLIHGADVLTSIENSPTRYQSPIDDLVISDCGVYSLVPSFGACIENLYANSETNFPTAPDVTAVQSKSTFYAISMGSGESEGY